MAKPPATRGGTDVAPANGNPWLNASRDIAEGSYLKFNGNDGFFSFGADDEELPEGSRVVVDMNSLAFGWICWIDSAVEEEVMVNIHDGDPPREEDLTDYDPEDPDDGWRAACSVSMFIESVGDDDQDEAVGTPLLFKTSTGGQVRQIKKLTKAYGRAFAQHPDELPIVELTSEGYTPKKKKYGDRKYSPIFKIVDWMTEEEMAALSEGLDFDDEDEDERPALPAPTKRKPAPEPEAEEDEEEDEPEEEAKPARRRRASEPKEEAKKPATRRRKAAPEPEEEEEDEPEEEAKPARRRRRAAEPKVEEEDEPEEEAKPARRRRAPKDDDEDAAPAPRGRSEGRRPRRARQFD